MYYLHSLVQKGAVERSGVRHLYPVPDSVRIVGTDTRADCKFRMVFVDILNKSASPHT